MLGRIMLTGALLAAAVAPAVAWGGGYATAGVSPPPPETAAGVPWNAELTILQHGRTPLAGVKPSVIIRPAGGGPARTFAAKPTAKPGVYVARVVFPKAGRWKYTIDDGFSARHDFAAVTIGGSGASAPAPAAARGPEAPLEAADDGSVDVRLAAGLALAVGTLTGVVVLALRRRRPGSGTTAPTGA